MQILLEYYLLQDFVLGGMDNDVCRWYLHDVLSSGGISVKIFLNNGF